MSLRENFTKDIEQRVPFVAIGILCALAIVAWRLVQLQVVQGENYQDTARSRGIRTVRLPAERGHITDTHGHVLARNARLQHLVATPADVVDQEAMLRAVADLTETPLAILQERFAVASSQSSKTPIVLVPHVRFEQLSAVLAWQSPWPELQQYDVRGLDVQQVYDRRYVDDVPLGHVLGYLKEINRTELDARAIEYPGRYVAGDAIGANGVESQWDHVMRGFDGRIIYTVDARGRRVAQRLAREQGYRPPERGREVRLTLDARLQRAAHDALGEHRGAIVALDPRTGAILAMVSKPDYDANRLMGPERNQYWGELREDPERPLINRALRGAYPPGSTYKIVVAAAAIEDDLVTQHEKIRCTGGLKFGGRRFGCWNRGGHGAVTLRQAMEQSCDVFFYELGQRLGVDRIADFAKRFSFGRATGIDLPYERTGLVPTKAWKKRVRKKAWLAGETLSVSIGQGYNLATPLQVATMTAMIANDGIEVFPHFVESQHERATAPERILDPEIVDRIAAGLIDVVEGPRATAKSLQKLDLKIAGKTGTAQVVGLLRAKGIRSHNDHAWFSAYAPYDDPQIAVAVFVEHGGSGGKVAAPIAGEVIKAYLAPEVDDVIVTDAKVEAQ